MLLARFPGSGNERKELQLWWKGGLLAAMAAERGVKLKLGGKPKSPKGAEVLAASAPNLAPLKLAAMLPT